MSFELPDWLAEANSLVVSKATNTKTQTTPKPTVKPIAVTVLIVEIVELVTVEIIPLPHAFQNASILHHGCQ
jgi:hypothetical protein